MSNRHFVVFFALTLTLSGCSLLGSRPAGALTYTGAIEQTVTMGQTMTGTDIRYIGYSDAGAQVIIGDQNAVKKPGDSLDWSGTPVAGANVTLSQRVLTASADRLQTVGTARITIDGVTPQAAQFPDRPAFSYKVAVTYTVRKGEMIPGTSITYKGRTDQGAELGGVSGLPYRKLGDSIGWTGSLRSNVYLDTTLRVIAYADELMQVGGLATIGLTQ